MRRVAKGAVVGVMRRHDHRPAARRQQAVKLLQSPDHVRNVLDDMDCPHFAKRTIPEGERELVEVRNHIGARVFIAIEADRTWIFVDSAADIQDRKHPWRARLRRFRMRGAYCSRDCRHCSSVSIAKSAWSRVITRGGHNRILFCPAPRISSPRSKAIASSLSRRSGARSFVS